MRTFQRNVPTNDRSLLRAINILVDGALWIVAVEWAALARFDFDVSVVSWATITKFAVCAAIGQLVIGLCFSLYRGRYTVGSFDEVTALAFTVTAVSTLATVVVVIHPIAGLPRSLPALALPLALTLTATARYGKRLLAQRRYRPAADAERVLVYGAGQLGSQLVQRMLRDPDSHFHPVGFIDDDPQKRNLHISGVPVLGSRNTLVSVAERAHAHGVVMAIDCADARLIRQTSDTADGIGLRCMVVPALHNLMGGSLRIGEVRDVHVEDVIGRHPVDTDISTIARYLTNRRVLVTGAGGSIGAELCKQIHKFGPSELVLLDRDESALHAVQLAIYGQGLLDSPQIVLVDIRDKERLETIFHERSPDVVFHAAALKHLPLLERYPHEAWKTNVIGTQNVLEVSAKVGVTRFVNISTDKAANPTSVLGYSKRLGEQLTSWISGHADGTYLSVRFGNVLGSRGSVLHAFQAQIDAGGPVMVTDPNVSRFFMTISEACQLVVQAGAIGRSGEALVLDMGDAVKIVEVAQRMIVASGKDVEIIFTGLRQGEKMHEDLLGDGEWDDRPMHPLISHVGVPPVRPEDLLHQRWSGTLNDSDLSTAGEVGAARSRFAW